MWKERQEGGAFGLYYRMPPVAGDIIGGIEYQTVFLMVIKKEQEFYFKPQIDAIKEKRSCLIRTF